MFCPSKISQKGELDSHLEIKWTMRGEELGWEPLLVAAV